MKFAECQPKYRDIISGGKFIKEFDYGLEIFSKRQQVKVLLTASIINCIINFLQV